MISGDMPLCLRRLSASSSRPVLAAEPWRSISRDDGGVGTNSSSVRRARSRRGGGRRPLTNSPEVDRQADAQGMANVEEEHTPGLARGGAAVAESRNDRGGLKVRPRDDDDQINPDEFKALLESYDNSFRNIAEG